MVARIIGRLAATLAVCVMCGATAGAAEPTRLGPETRLPLPRYVSLNIDKANVRRGPGMSHRIDWEFLLRDAPLQVIAEHGHWRKVRDAEGYGGWIHHSLLRGTRTALVTATPMANLRHEPVADTPIVARAEAGAVGRIDRCTPIWCRFSAQGQRGWVQKADIWGVDPGDVFD
jgi:SH3-like domain-containing protein